jgi:hypothetical protein
MLKRKLAVAAFTMFGCVVGSQGSVLFDNGSSVGQLALCHSNAMVCGGDGWTVYDDFQLTQTSHVTGFGYDFYWEVSDGFNDSNYVSTNWSIWNGDPFAIGPAGKIFSGTAVGVLGAGANGSTHADIGGLGINLAVGIYWLGLQENVTDNALSTEAQASIGFGMAAEQSDNAGQFFNLGIPDQAFFIVGNAVPEPASLALVGLALGAACWARLGTCAPSRRRDRTPPLLAGH